ncbi:Type II secretory pathway component [Stutzerimonas kunmingensis]|uniref:Type II secretory pathway component n=1 Tax=Stutzerimonas kunmingensis TaxID=1211807 RepID=UPI00052D1548|nr:Type II secretory pathway component [Stutzerimonas kunmingensis]CEG50793.1 putative mannose-sensitive agglutinin biogenesis protein MshK [Stutzerimonas xanthomarina]
MSDFSRAFCLFLLLPASAYALDPTRPPAAFVTAAAERQAPATLHLQAIFRGAQSARAVLNGQSLRVGDILADARVLAINTNSVLIERDGQQQTLRLVAPIITPSQVRP